MNFEEIEIIDRDFYMFGEIDNRMAIELSTFINTINKYDDLAEDDFISSIESLISMGTIKSDSIAGIEPREPITININSNGGSTSSGFSIISAIENSRTPIIGSVVGDVMSMAIPILASCDFRSASEYSKFMMHDVHSISEGKFNDLNSSIEYIGSVKDDYIKVTSKYTNMTEEKVKEITDKNSDYFFSSEEALEMGLIDYIDGDTLDEDEYFDKLYGSSDEEESVESVSGEESPKDKLTDEVSVVGITTMKDHEKKSIEKLIDLRLEQVLKSMMYRDK